MRLISLSVTRNKTQLIACQHEIAKTLAVDKLRNSELKMNCFNILSCNT